MQDLLRGLQPLIDAISAAAFATAFTLWGSPQTWLEVLAFALAVVMVICNMRVNTWAWPLAIISSLLYFALFWRSRLYGDASLQIFFAVVALWGWWQWLRGSTRKGEPLRVRTLPARGRWACLAALLVAWPLTGAYLHVATDTDVPWWDAFPTAGSLIGQWLLGRKYVENWPVWIIVNVVGVALFAYKGLWLTVVLYALFVLMAAIGWRAWQRLAAGSTVPQRAERRAAIGQRPMAFVPSKSAQADLEPRHSAPSRPAVPSGDRPTYPSDEGPT